MRIFSLDIPFTDHTIRQIDRLTSGVCFFLVALLISDLGFEKSPLQVLISQWFYGIALLFLLFSEFICWKKGLWSTGKRKQLIWKLGRVLLAAFALFFLYRLFHTDELSNVDSFWPIQAVAVTLSAARIFRWFAYLGRLNLSAAQLFILGFVLLIVIGSILLMLPRSTTQPIALSDAIFTATSAVCVTGLATLNTAEDFTLVGQTIILVLIQLGGLGVMGFVSYFGFFSSGGDSFKNRLMLRDLMNVGKVTQTVKTFSGIVLFTLAVEAIGALLIYISLPNQPASAAKNIFFALFHSVSAFCNAGFSTVQDGLYNPMVSSNFHLHNVIAFLVILGGIGFPIAINLYNYLLHLGKRLVSALFNPGKQYHFPRVININTRLAAVTTGLLLMLGFAGYILFEWSVLVQEESWYGRITTAFFATVTPRTAGFNTFDVSALSTSTIMLFLFLMWIGGSPGSTAGGIKTSTLAAAVLNCFSIAKRKTRLEIWGREIEPASLQRAFVLLFLSVLCIGLVLFGLAAIETDKPFLALLFESVSAFSTVGLSMGITGDLATGSKWILIGAMLVGRVGTLTWVLALGSRAKSSRLRLPKEQVFID